MRAADWSSTPLGPVEEWPQSLRTAVSIMLASKFAMVVAWGPEYRFFYNDRYQPILGVKHPAALGKPGAEIFPEVWPVVGPEFDRVARGEAFAVDDWLLPLERNGYLESCWFTLSYSPIRDESGGVGGVLAVVVETTERVDGERRMATLRDLARRASAAKQSDDACRSAAEVFAQNTVDVPFALLYLLDEDGTTATRVARVGLVDERGMAPERVALAAADDAPGGWPLAAALDGLLVVDDLRARFGALPGGAWPESAETAVILPLARPGMERPYGLLVAGVSPRRRLDDAYRGFFELAVEHITTAISNARAFESERRRAEALAAVDRAKTMFFSNVSHEFRTPLTLLLAPLEDALSEMAPVVSADSVAAMHRNALRLLKLVNALLDFSRIEAGRMEAVYEPTDLSTLTADLASVFRAAIERAGLTLQVETTPLGTPAWVDRHMWEKIVLNLLSNAFKFTFEGGITVRLREVGARIVLEVEDTGTGIAPAELPRLFERFHRVEGARARTEEGSGIGLALVQELVRLHGGEITVESVPGRGSCFRVGIPRGNAHLPPQRLGGQRALASTSTTAAAHVEEALRWLPDEATVAAGEAGAERVLVADDNADMRDYLQRTLGRHWRVEAVPDGAAALRCAQADPPDLVLTDVMMPVLDGFGLLRALRADPRTESVPVVMLSARAGEEARVEGLRAGADEYLVKPFSARELLARVRSQLALSKARAAAAANRAEAELQKRNVASLLMQAPMPVCILRGPRHIVELANPECCAVWGRRAEEVLGRPLLEALPEIASQPFPALLRQVMETGTRYRGEDAPARFDRGDGRVATHYFNFVYEPLRDVDGRVDGVMVIAFDVTSGVEARQQLDRLRVEAEAANRAKDEFLAILSHELRNPLSPMLTAMELLRLRGGDVFGRELAILDRQARHLVRLVDDLLDVSRLARGKVSLDRKTLDLAAVIAHAVEMVEPLLEERGQTLVQELAERDLWVDGDAQRLAQVVSNLLSNAARYSERGSRVELAARRVEGRVEVVVRDHGVGISAELLPRLFEPFVQGPQRLARPDGGLGLGLAIVNSLVSLHGGEVAAESAGTGKGSVFRVRLPLVPPPCTAGEGDLALTAAVPGGGRRVLVVDDNRDAADLLAEALVLAGYEVRVAYDGPQALTVANELRPEVALLDIGLPVQDGYEVGRRLRELLSGAQPQLVAMSGYGLASDLERSREAGFLAHLTKPLDVGAVRSLLGTLFAPPS